MSNPCEHLESLLVECFAADAGALRKFATRHYGAQFAAELPGGDATAVSVATGLIDGLQRRGLLDTIFFSKLQQHASPTQTRELTAAAADFGISLSTSVVFASEEEARAARGRFPTAQTLSVLVAMVVCIWIKRIKVDVDLAARWFVWVGVGALAWLLLLVVPQQREWVRQRFNHVATALRQITARSLLERARQQLDRVYGSASLGWRAFGVAAMFACLGVALAIGIILLSPIDTSQIVEKLTAVAIFWVILVLLVENTICQIVALAASQRMLRWIVGRAPSSSSLFVWSLLYFLVTATLAALPAFSYFLPPLPFMVHLDAISPTIASLFEGLLTAQADLSGAHHYGYVFWAIVVSTTITACLPSLIIAVIVLAAASARVRGGMLVRAIGVVFENLASLPQDIVQLAYAVLTILGAFLTLWILA